MPDDSNDDSDRLRAAAVVTLPTPPVEEDTSVFATYMHEGGTVHLTSEELQRIVSEINNFQPITLALNPPPFPPPIYDVDPSPGVHLTIRARGLGFDPAANQADATALAYYWNSRAEALSDIQLDPLTFPEDIMSGSSQEEDARIIDAAQALFNAVHNPMGGDDNLDVLWHRLGVALHGHDHHIVKRIDPTRKTEVVTPTRSAWAHLTDEED